MSPFLEAQIDALHRGQPLGHRLPRHADRHRVPGARRVRRDAAAHRGAAAQEAAALRACPTRPATSRSASSASPSSTSDLTDAELKERQEFLAENTLRSRARSTTPEIWERMGVDARGGAAVADRGGREDRHAASSPGFQRGVLRQARARTSASSACSTPTTATCASCGARPACCEFEFADDTGSDYETYDEVAKDRGEGRGCGRLSRSTRGEHDGDGDRSRARGRAVPRRAAPVARGQPARGARRRGRRARPQLMGGDAGGRRAWTDKLREAGYLCVSLAEGVRRPRADGRRGRGDERGVRPRRRARGSPGAWASGSSARRSSCGAPTSRRRTSCRASSTAPTATARASREPDAGSATSPASRPGASSTATRS